MIRTPAAASTASNAAVNLASRSRIKNFKGRPVFEVHQQVPGLLGHPLSRRVGGDSGRVHLAGAVLDEEQHVQAAQEHGVDMEEVHGQNRLGLGAQERPPGLPGPLGCRVDARILEDLPHRRRGDRVPQSGQFAVDAPVTPAGVVPRHLQHQRPDHRHGPGPPGRPARVGPPPPDQLGVPALQGPRGDDQPQLAKMTARQQAGQRSQDCPVSPGQSRRLNLALEYGDLMPQDQDLGVLSLI